MSVVHQVLDLLDSRTSLALLLVSLLTYWYFRRPNNVNLPPGPMCWPVIGSLPSIAKTDDLHLKFLDWQKEYGPVTYFRMGMLDAVVLGGYDVIYQALVKQAEAFSSRPVHLAIVSKISKNKGIAMIPSGPLWKEHRKFALLTLRSFGFGKRGAEAKILEESAVLCQEILNTGGKPFSITRLVQKATTNVICSLVFAHRFEYEDPQFLRIMEDFDTIAGTNFINMPENIFPFLRHVMNSADKLLKATALPMDYIRSQMREHQETFDRNDIRDFIDAFLLEMKTQDPSTSTFTEDQLVATVFDLFIGGTESTSTALRWVSLLMMANPDIQRKVQEEIDSVLGPDQPPTMSHRAQLPYTQAVLTEVFRFACIVAVIVPHTTTQDTNLNGYHIPNQTMVLPNLWSVHYDEKLFPDPYKFDPTRFLDGRGQYKKDEHVMPFSAGPRMCLGEQLARMELFLFFTSLMQHFTFKLPDGASVSPHEGITAGIRAPKPFDMIAVARN
ncbi:PREDICTED: cytochrome P450 2C15-like [Branchiostoma belcheri]|uniref:Cytochrome P450 2U1 n=1 Tax=Branchiostoma belcheri TaxID=7741 RepID=A0A6P4XW85_BRABE|nr:PREDICTED: cytochrome P450 2C15-like [Branchiostoma belcheri]